MPISLNLSELLASGRPALGYVKTLLPAVPYKRAESSNPASSSTTLIYPQDFLPQQERAVQRYALSPPLMSVATTWEINKVQHTTISYKGDDTSLIDRQNHRLLQLSFIATT